jgi:pimeloyl-ACP methyl ester carboxylesterase
MPGGPIEVREGYADVGGQRLHCVEAGDGPLLVLLHGFPEFWFGWRLQIQPLAAAGFRVVAPDTRAYNLSSKPDGFEAYGVDLLAADIVGLIGELGAESTRLVGHDWGGSIAWTMALNHPEVVDRLAILNAAHPRKLSEGLKHPSQLRRSWYFFFFAHWGVLASAAAVTLWDFESWSTTSSRERIEAAVRSGHPHDNDRAGRTSALVDIDPRRPRMLSFWSDVAATPQHATLTPEHPSRSQVHAFPPAGRELHAAAGI